jgi:hypothetical protein
MATERFIGQHVSTGRRPRTVSVRPANPPRMLGKRAAARISKTYRRAEETQIYRASAGRPDLCDVAPTTSANPQGDTLGAAPHQPPFSLLVQSFALASAC